MNAAIGWGLAVAAVAAGYVSWGWQGVALAVTAVVFWLLLQFSRALRVLRISAQAPVGLVRNSVMLHSQLHKGMRLPDILKLTHSLGHRVASEPETWSWADSHGDEVRVVMHNGKVATWELKRAPA